MAKVKKHRGLESLKSRYGLAFISPWILGMVLFFVYPIFQSVFISFSELKINEDGITTKFIGLESYKTILMEDPDYLDNLLASFSEMLVSLPFILIVSMVLAIMLNGEFKGRIFFRGLFFLPVIFATGDVLQLFLQVGAWNATSTAVSESVEFGMINFSEVLRGLNLPDFMETYVSKALSNIFMLVWQSGIQTILILAGLQSIPELLYEVARVEGATKWEEFWFITLPMLMRTIFLVIIFTLIELVSSVGNDIVKTGYDQFELMEYGLGSAMLWFYFLFVGVLVAVLYVIYSKMFVKKWG